MPLPALVRSGRGDLGFSSSALRHSPTKMNMRRNATAPQILGQLISKGGHSLMLISGDIAAAASTNPSAFLPACHAALRANPNIERAMLQMVRRAIEIEDEVEYLATTL